MIRAGKKRRCFSLRLPNSVKSNLKDFVNDSVIRSFLFEINKVFPDFKNYRIEIAKGLNRCENIFKYQYQRRKLEHFSLYLMQMFTNLIQ